jgi:GntR family transcriptional regulator, transcriptional repressor for pyruvate dehydrogenase complex
MTDGQHSASLISPLAAAGRADEVVSKVSQAIQLGLFVDGEQLPPETEFAAQLGVSAMTLREALASLRQQGLVETRRGRTGGTFVRRPSAPPLGILRERLRGLTTTTLRDLVDEQFAVSGAAAKLAAERAPGGSVRRLRALVLQLSGAASLGSQIRADSRFHIEVAIASHSERLTRLEVALQTQLAELLWLPPEEANGSGVTAPAELLDPVAASAEHAAIADAIAAEDGDTARLLTERHVEANLRRLTALRLAMTERATSSSARPPATCRAPTPGTPLTPARSRRSRSPAGGKEDRQ